MKKWEQLELWICDQLRDIDPYVKRTPGSGNGGCKGDIKFSSPKIQLHIEAKWRNLKSVFNLDWFTKTESEISLHSDKMALLITENKDGKKMAHLNADDFFEIYKRSLDNGQ